MHWVEPFQGERCTVVLYTTNKTKNDHRKDRREEPEVNRVDERGDDETSALYMDLGYEDTGEAEEEVRQRCGRPGADWPLLEASEPSWVRASH